MSRRAEDGYLSINSFLKGETVASFERIVSKLDEFADSLDVYITLNAEVDLKDVVSQDDLPSAFGDSVVGIHGHALPRLVMDPSRLKSQSVEINAVKAFTKLVRSHEGSADERLELGRKTVAVCGAFLSSLSLAA